MPQDALGKEFDAIVENYSQAEPVPEQSEDHDQLIKSIDDWWKQDSEAHDAETADWDFYRRMRRGDSIAARHKETGEIVRLSGEDSRKLSSQMNILHATARSLIGKLVRNIPGVTVRPGSADFDEQHGARVADALIKYGMEDQNGEIKYIEAHEHLPDDGNAFLELGWDPYAGRKRAFCPQPSCGFSEADEDLIGQECPACKMEKEQAEQQFAMQMAEAKADAMSEVLQVMPPGTQPDPSMIPEDYPMPERPPELDMPVPLMVEVHEGKPIINVLDPREVTPEAGARNLEECRRLTVRTIVPVSAARQMYPEFAELIRSDDGMVIDQSAEMRGVGISGELDTEVLTDHCWVWRIFSKPTERHPHGRVIHRVNDLIVKDLGIDLLAELPPAEQLDNPYYTLERFPVYHFGFDRRTGEFWFSPALENAWHRQKELDRMEGNFREWAELWIKPRMLIPIGSRISTDEISANGAQLIKYNANAGPPIPLSVQPWPGQLVERRNELIGDIRLQMATTESDAGVSPSDPNRRAMAIVEAESDQSIGPILKRNHAEWKALWRGYVQLFQALASEDLTFAIAGPEGTVAHTFKDMVLKSGWDVMLEQDDGLSQNKAMRLTQAADLANLGLYNDPLTGMMDTKRFMHHVGLNMPSAGYDMERTETAAAAQIPFKIMQGQPWQPMPEDDAPIHARELLGWLRGPGRQMEMKNPQLVMQIRQIWMYYAQLVIMDMMGGAVPGAPPLGMPPGTGTGGPMGGPGAGGPDQSAPGGSANGVGHMGSDVRANAGATVQQADRGAETLARVSPKHEG